MLKKLISLLFVFFSLLFIVGLSNQPDILYVKADKVEHRVIDDYLLSGLQWQMNDQGIKYNDKFQISFYNNMDMVKRKFLKNEFFYSSLLFYDNGMSTFIDSSDKTRVDHQEGWPVKFEINSSWCSMIYDTVVYDLEGDGNLDVVVTYNLLEDESYIDAYNLNGFRKTDLGFPIFIEGRITSGASVGDLDNDGDLEIVITVYNHDVVGCASLYVFEFDGNKFVESWHFKEDLSSKLFIDTPVLGDIDGDGDLEIIFGNGRNEGEMVGVVYAFHHNGSMVSGWPIIIDTAHWTFNSLALGDIDNDGRMEIVAGSVEGYVYAWNGDGSLVMGNWPVNIGDCILGQSPQIGDLDNDGEVEVIQISNNNGSVFVFDCQGNIIQILETLPAGIGEPTALGDIDNDGDLEIFANIYDYVYGWYHNGTLIDGWPVYAGRLHTTRESMILGDINSDCKPDVIFMPKDSTAGIYAFHANGTLIEGWPYLLPNVNNIYSTPLLTDLDKDGDVEVVFTYAYLYWPGVNGSSFTIDVLDIPGLYNTTTMHWPMYQHDPQHTGFYGFRLGDLKAYVHGPFYGLINKPMKFSGAATGGSPPFSWYWDFGDGESSYEQNPTHIFTEPGNYTVVFTVTDNTSNFTSDTTWAKIKESNNPPNKPSISGPTYGKKGQLYNYDFVTIDPDGDKWIKYYIDWGDNTNTGWIGPYSSGEIIISSHKWTNKGTYTIKCKAQDPYGDEGPYGELKVIIPRNKILTNSLQLKFLQMFPFFEKLLNL